MKNAWAGGIAGALFLLLGTTRMYGENQVEGLPFESVVICRWSRSTEPTGVVVDFSDYRRVLVELQDGTSAAGEQAYRIWREKSGKARFTPGVRIAVPRRREIVLRPAQLYCSLFGDPSPDLRVERVILAPGTEGEISTSVDRWWKPGPESTPWQVVDGQQVPRVVAETPLGDLDIPADITDPANFLDNVVGSKPGRFVDVEDTFNCAGHGSMLEASAF